MNARIQGLYKLYRGARDNPMSFFLKGSMIMAASIALLAANWDDPRYQNLPEWDRDTYWHFWVGDTHLRFPKPFEVGAIFGTVPERLMQSMAGDEEWSLFANRMGHMVLDTFAMNPVPQAIRPLAEQFFNRDMFTGNPLIGLALDGLPPEAQYQPRTSETLRALAEAMPDWAPAWLRSPKRLEAAVQGYSGALGMYALSAADELTRGIQGAPTRPALKIWNAPIATRFVRDPVPWSNKWQKNLYEWPNEANSYARAIREFTRRGEQDKAQEMRIKYLDELQARAHLNRVRDRSAKINTQIRIIQFNQTMAPDEKFERIQKPEADQAGPGQLDRALRPGCSRIAYRTVARTCPAATPGGPRGGRALLVSEIPGSLVLEFLDERSVAKGLPCRRSRRHACA